MIYALVFTAGMVTGFMLAFVWALCMAAGKPVPAERSEQMRWPWQRSNEPKWEPRDDDAYDWSMMRGVRGVFGGIMTVGPNEERPKPRGEGWVGCDRCGRQGWDADWGGPFRCRRCEGAGWLKEQVTP